MTPRRRCRGTDDPVVKGIAIPREYWKVVVIRKSDGTLSATAYLLSQSDLLKQMLVLEFEYGAYRAFQLLVSDLQQKTGLDFGQLRDHDPKRRAEGVAADRPIELTSFTQIVL